MHVTCYKMCFPRASHPPVLPAGVDLYTTLQQASAWLNDVGLDSISNHQNDSITTEQTTPATAPLVVQLTAAVSLADSVCAASSQGALMTRNQSSTDINDTQSLPLLADMQPIVNLTQPLVLTGTAASMAAAGDTHNNPGNITSFLPPAILDLAAVPHQIAYGSPDARLILQNLSLFNPPPGPPSTYPLGLSTLMMWTVSLDRAPQAPGCSSPTSAAAVVMEDCVMGLPDEGEATVGVMPHDCEAVSIPIAQATEVQKK
jgi:hypothetical protein